MQGTSYHYLQVMCLYNKNPLQLTSNPIIPTN